MKAKINIIYLLLAFSILVLITQSVTTGNSFRFIAIPGNTETLKSASLENFSEKELRSMPYQEVCKLFNIPE